MSLKYAFSRFDTPDDPHHRGGRFPQVTQSDQHDFASYPLVRGGLRAAQRIKMVKDFAVKKFGDFAVGNDIFGWSLLGVGIAAGIAGGYLGDKFSIISKFTGITDKLTGGIFGKLYPRKR